MIRYDNARTSDSKEPRGTLRGELPSIHLEVKERADEVYIASTKEEKKN
jgi:hypothetical protein